MSDQAFGLRGGMAGLMMVESDVVENEGEGPGGRGVW
jgi:hypothetical protein